MSLLSIAAEKALVAYISPMLSGVTVSPGHSNETSNDLQRVIITATSSGGSFSQNAGIDELEIEIICLTSAGELTGDTDPVGTLAVIADEIRYAISIPQIDYCLTVLNTAGNIVFSGIEFGSVKEGRDTERALHGVQIQMTAWAANSY